jgi:uncharacterized protein
VKIGVISDTHGYLDPRVQTIFTGVDHILHAGDIGYRITEVVEMARKKFLIHHIVNPWAQSETLERHIAIEKPAVVVFGHTHKKFAETINGMFFFNPGYAGKPKAGAERSVAILHVEGEKIRPEFFVLM